MGRGKLLEKRKVAKDRYFRSIYSSFFFNEGLVIYLCGIYRREDSKGIAEIPIFLKPAKIDIADKRVMYIQIFTIPATRRMVSSPRRS